MKVISMDSNGYIHIGEYEIRYDSTGEVYDILLNGNLETGFFDLYEAIKYCIEN
jgi:hypothetical protein